jgi:PEGA domain
MSLHKVFLIAVVAGTCSTALAQIVLPEGTRVRVRLEQTLTSATAEEGQPVNFTVTEDVRIADTVVIAQGATCVGSIISAVPKRRLGRSGKLDFSIDRVVAVDGTSVPLRYSPTKKEGGSNATKAGVLTGAAAVVFWPAAPVFLLIKGKDVTVHRGIVVDVFTDQRFVLAAKAPVMPPAGSTTLQPALQAGATPGAPAAALTPGVAAAAGGSATVTVRSQPEGADIEFDGAYVGSTPSTLQLTPGAHGIVVRKGAAKWRRTIQVQAGSTLTVNAALALR